jgi:hypothetical protein
MQRFKEAMVLDQPELTVEIFDGLLEYHLKKANFVVPEDEMKHYSSVEKTKHSARTFELFSDDDEDEDEEMDSSLHGHTTFDPQPTSVHQRVSGAEVSLAQAARGQSPLSEEQAEKVAAVITCTSFESDPDSVTKLASKEMSWDKTYIYYAVCVENKPLSSVHI